MRASVAAQARGPGSGGGLALQRRARAPRPASSHRRCRLISASKIGVLSGAKDAVIRRRGRRGRAAGRPGTSAWSSPWVRVVGRGIGPLVVDGRAAGRRSHAEHAQGAQQGKEKPLHDVPRWICRLRPVGRAPSPSPSPVLLDGIRYCTTRAERARRGGPRPPPHHKRCQHKEIKNRKTWGARRRLKGIGCDRPVAVHPASAGRSRRERFGGPVTSGRISARA